MVLGTVPIKSDGHVFPNNGHGLYSIDGPIKIKRIDPDLKPLHQLPIEQTRTAVNSDTFMQSILGASGLIFHQADAPLTFTTTLADHKSIGEFFREVVLPPNAISFANAITVKNIQLPPELEHGKQLQSLGGSALIRSVLGANQFLKILSVKNLRKLFSLIGCTVTNDEQDKAIWRWGFIQSKDELERVGIFYDKRTNTVHMVDPVEDWRKASIKLVRGNQIATVSLAHFPNVDVQNEALTVANKSITGKLGIKSKDDLKLILKHLGFNVANEMETMIFVQNNQNRIGNYLQTRYAQETIGPAKQAELGLMIAKTILHLWGAEDFRTVAMSGSEGLRRENTPLLTFANPSKPGFRYLALLKSSLSTKCGNCSEEELETIVRRAKELSTDVPEKVEYVPCLVYIKDINPKTWTGKIVPKIIKPNSTPNSTNSEESA